MMQKDTPVNGPHQGAWVDTQTGEDWFLHFQDVYAAGRIVHLQPMKWLDNDWPIIGEYEEGDEAGKPVLVHKKPNVGAEFEVVCPESSDEFDGDTLGLQWQWNSNWKEEWYTLMPKKSQIRLHAVKKNPETSISNTGNLLIQKWSMPEFTSVAKMNVSGLQKGDIAGFISLGEKYVALSVENAVNGKKLCLLTGDQSYDGQICYATDAKTVIDEIGSDEIFFKMTVHRIPSTEVNDEGPYVFPVPKEEVELFYSEDGDMYKSVYRFVPKAGRWVGVKFGVFCCQEGETDGGYADVDYVRLTSEEA
jgi:beta-xylosidase